jgi:predicted transcriptional regulator
MKLTIKQIWEIIELSNSGKKQVDIANALGISKRVVSYWMQDKDKRKEISKRVYANFKRKSPEEKKEIYKKRLPYIKAWWKKRYAENETFREKEKGKSRKQYEKKKQ